MNALTLIMLLVGADPVQVPVAGRPVDFSGAVGGPFEVRYRHFELIGNMAPKGVGESNTLHIDINGPGDFSSFRTSAFLQSSTQFIVDDVKLVNQASTQTRTLTYNVRFKAEGNIVLPSLKLVYYNPAVRNWQTTYSSEFSIYVQGNRPAHFPEMLAWADRLHALAEHEDENSFARKMGSLADQVGLSNPYLVFVNWYFDRDLKSSRWFWAMWSVPPFISAFALWRWRRGAATGGSQTFLTALARIDTKYGGDPSRIRELLICYLREVHGLPDTANTPSDISLFLGRESSATDVLKKCDQARFGLLELDPQELSLAAQNALTFMENGK